MRLLEFARLVRSGNSVLPTDPFMKAHLIWHSVDELQREPYDPLRNAWYLRTFEEANLELGRVLEQDRWKSEAETQGKIDNMVGELWRLIKQHFVWFDSQVEKTIPLDGKLKWSGEKEMNILTSAGMKKRDFHCSADGSEVSLKPLLAFWIKEYASRLLQENAQPNIVHLTKDLLRAFPSVPIHCPYADKLIHPRESCSIFTSGSSEVFHCSTINLELRPI